MWFAIVAVGLYAATRLAMRLALDRSPYFDVTSTDFDVVTAVLARSRLRVRLDDVSRLPALRDADGSLPGLDRRGDPVSIRARAILELGEIGPDGRRLAIVRDGRRTRWVGVGLLLAGLAARRAIIAGAAEPAWGVALGNYVAAMTAVVSLLFLAYGFGAGRPTA